MRTNPLAGKRIYKVCHSEAEMKQTRRAAIMLDMEDVKVSQLYKGGDWVVSFTIAPTLAFRERRKGERTTLPTRLPTKLRKGA